MSVIDGAGSEPHSAWVPDVLDEPTFLAYSVTKTFTAAIVLSLCDEGRLGLGDPLSRFFRGIDRAARICIRQLLNHTAGVPDYLGGVSVCAMGAIEDGFSAEGVVASILDRCKSAGRASHQA